MPTPRGFFERLGPGIYQRTARGVNWRVVAQPRETARDERPWHILRNGEHFDRTRSLSQARHTITATEHRGEAARARKVAGIRLSDLSGTQSDALRSIYQNNGRALGYQYRTTDSLAVKGYLEPWNGTRYEFTAKGRAWLDAYYSAEANRPRPRRVK